MIFRNILVPYDGSKHALHAFKIAVNMAQKYESKLTVATCLPARFSGSWYVDNRIADAEFKGQCEAIKKEFVKLKAIAKKSKISLNSKILNSQQTVQAILKYAKTKKFDLLVMGSHGRTKWDKLILGSVANGVAQRIRCPVLIVR